LESQVLKAEQSNTSLLYGDKLYLKFYRRLDEGSNPDLEIGKFLTEEVAFSRVPPFAGSIEYRKPGAQPIVIGILQGYVPNEGDAWRYTIDATGRYFERVLSIRNETPVAPKAPSSILQLAYQEIPPFVQELIGGVHLEMAALLGKRTAELHLALSSNKEDPNFAPEPYTMLFQRSLYQSMQSRARQVLTLLRKSLSRFPREVGEKGQEVLNLDKQIMERFKLIYQKKISTMKIRIHGDYHLGQVLYTGNDFFIIDFEGEPARPLSERRLKHSPFRDVVGMVRSFHYKAYTTLITQAWVRPEDVPVLEPWADLWFKYISATFLRSYLDTAKGAPFVPEDRQEVEILMNVFLLDKALYEMAYELNNRPDWVLLPLKGIKDLLEVPHDGK
jgi:maltose alpha-D-glucosyltransferase/alpha-amylase